MPDLRSRRRGLWFDWLLVAVAFALAVAVGLYDRHKAASHSELGREFQFQQKIADI